jgi:NitT/TauT family transport system permease protein
MSALRESKSFAVFTVIAVLLVVWYLASILMNLQPQLDSYKRFDLAVPALPQLIADLLSQVKPILPAPHQVIGEVWNGVAGQDVASKRSLLQQAGITLAGTGLGFLMGTVFGLLLAVYIVHNEAANRSLMPWIIASQTIPILAIAPMLVVGFNAIGLQGLLPKALISTYLSFFPVVVGMVKGFRSPDQMQLDLMRTYNASRSTVFWKLRWPASTPYLFTSMKIGIAIALIGALVAELTYTAGGGLGVRLLTGSYNGQTVVMWAVLVIAATLAATLVISVGIVERLVLRSMGTQPG